MSNITVPQEWYRSSVSQEHGKDIFGISVCRARSDCKFLFGRG